MTKENRVDPRSSLVWLGDATIHALHPYWDTAITPSQIQYQPVNLCVSGETVASLTARIKDGLLDQLKPRLIILNIGMNDLPKTPSTQVAERIIDLARFICRRHPHASVGIHALVPKGYRTPIRLRNQVEAVNAKLRESALPPKTRLIEMYDIFVGAKRRFSLSDRLATVDYLPQDSLDEWVGDELDTISMDISESVAFDTLG